MANPQVVQDAGSDKETHLPSYISGYFDGEGCFSVALSPRSKLKVGWELRPSVSVSQNSDRSEVIWEIQHYFGCGSVRPDRSDQTLKWEVRNSELLRQRVLPHFRQYPLRSSKQRDLEILTEVCARMSTNDHLQAKTLVPILEIIAEMNPSGIRKYQISAVIDELRRR